MDLTPKDAFKLGFLKKVAELGHTPSSFNKLVKSSSFIGRELSGITDAAGDVLRGGGLMAGAGVIGLPILAGMGTGWVHNRLADVDEEDVKNLKRKQLIQALRRETFNVKNRTKRKNRRPHPRMQSLF